eukprot:symbB.v1.2.028481.t1/scaffold3024.1/size65071/3
MASSSLVYILLPGDALSAWKMLRRSEDRNEDGGKTALEGMTSLTFSRNTAQFLTCTLPKSLETLSFGAIFNQSLRGYSFPVTLRHLILGDQFNEPLEGVTFPKHLETLTFGDNFNQSLQSGYGLALEAVKLHKQGRSLYSSVIVVYSLSTTSRRLPFLKSDKHDLWPSI